jgi:transmembrane sensor
MSEQYKSNISATEQEAIAWLQKLASGRATPDDVASAERWRTQDTEHRKAYADAERVWERMSVIGRVKYGGEANFMEPLQEYGRRRAAMTRRTILGAGVASIGAAAIYGAMRPPLGLWPSLSEMRADFRTGTGEQRTIAFAGDVEIALNTQTSLAVRPPTDTEDRIELVSGEAAFATPSRASRSLAVFAADGKILSQSSRFEIRCTGNDRVSVACLEGKLQVESAAKVAELKAGQRLLYKGGDVSAIDTVDPQAVSEWRRGIVTFHNTPLAEAVEEMNRYRPGRIILRGDSLGRRLLSGRFRTDQMEQALVQIEYTFKSRVTRYPGGIVVLS